MLIIDGSNITTGGGKTLLEGFLKQLNFTKQKILIFLDTRLKLSVALSDNFKVKKIPPTVKDRFSLQLWLLKHTQKKDTVFYFGNLPPLFSLKARIFVFMQNRLLIEQVSLNGYTLKSRFRMLCERVLINFKYKNADIFFTATPTMKKLLSKRIRNKRPVKILDIEKFIEKGTAQNKKGNYFIYPADSHPHKNHITLIKAWVMLASQNIRPKLYLTIEKKENDKVLKFLARQNIRHSLNIENLGFLSKKALEDKYLNAKALIYPSLVESLGIPLIEAKIRGLDILAGKRDFVYDVCRPVMTFDGSSPSSVAETVKKYLKSA